MGNEAAPKGTSMSNIVQWLDFAGVAVFAASGALVASRKEMDAVGFIFIATITAVGGGTLRDLLLSRDVFWITQPEYLLLSAATAALLFFVAPHIERRYPVLLWLDSGGLSLFAVTGAAVALDFGVSWPVGILMGVMTATFGGLIRDVVCNEIPLILRKEIYATAAALGAGVYVALDALRLDEPIPGIAGFASCLVLRAFAIQFKLSLPTYRARPGRDYPLD